jgi:beta-lactamase regulating signal transducer with metallopeptidase domain
MSLPNGAFWLHLLGTVGVEICVVAALGFVAHRFLRHALWQRAVWQAAVICSLLLAASEWTGFGRGTAGFLFGQKRVVENTQASGISTASSEAAGELVAVRSNRPPAAPRSELWWPGWMWLAGTVIVLGRMAVAQGLLVTLRLRREKIASGPLRDRVEDVANRVGVRQKVSLLRLPKARSPMAFGIVRPSIGLPPAFEGKFSVTEQEAVLAHELAHLAVMDPLWFLLADFASALLWWHPLIWWVRRSLHVSAELAADEATALVPEGPGALAKCLVALGKEMTSSPRWGWVGINGGFRSELGKRVERLMQMSSGAKRPLAGRLGTAARIAMTILIVPTVLLLFASFQSAHAQKEDSWRGELRESWNNSPGGLLMLAALEDQQTERPSIVVTNQVSAGSASVVGAPSTPGGTLPTIGSNKAQNAEILYNPGAPDQPLRSRVYHVNPKVFAQHLTNIIAQSLSLSNMNSMVWACFTAAHLDLRPPKFVFFNERQGALYVRASASDLKVIEPLVSTLDWTPPQVSIEAKFASLSQEDSSSLAHGTTTSTPSSDAFASSGVNGIMSDFEFRIMINKIEQRTGADILSSPKAVTASGRQVHLGISDRDKPLSVNVIPAVGPDGFSIQLAVVASINPGHRTVASQNVQDGQTLVFSEAMTNQPPGARRTLVFITPRIIDSAGNPVHEEDEISKRPATSGQ